MVSKLKEIRDALLTWEPSADYLDHLRQRVASPTEAADQLATVCDWTFRLHLGLAAFLVTATLSFLALIVGILIERPWETMCAQECTFVVALFVGAAIAVYFAVAMLMRAGQVRSDYTALILYGWLTEENE